MSGSRTNKQEDLLNGALRVFAREGFSRARIEAIAAEAGVSTRTIYNHYPDKASLFHTVIVSSAEHTARHQINIVQHLLDAVTKIETALIDFGMVWARPDPETALHFALVRQIRADLQHIPEQTIQAWQRTGPRRVQTEIADHLRRLSDQDLITIPPGKPAAELAAAQLVALTAGVADRTGKGPSRAALLRTVESGVQVFLSAYQTAR